MKDVIRITSMNDVPRSAVLRGKHKATKQWRIIPVHSEWHCRVLQYFLERDNHFSHIRFVPAYERRSMYQYKETYIDYEENYLDLSSVYKMLRKNNVIYMQTDPDDHYKNVQFFIQEAGELVEVTTDIYIAAWLESGLIKGNKIWIHGAGRVRQKRLHPAAWTADCLNALVGYKNKIRVLDATPEKARKWKRGDLVFDRRDKDREPQYILEVLRVKHNGNIEVHYLWQKRYTHFSLRPEVLIDPTPYLGSRAKYSRDDIINGWLQAQWKMMQTWNNRHSIGQTVRVRTEAQGFIIRNTSTVAHLLNNLAVVWLVGEEQATPLILIEAML